MTEPAIEPIENSKNAIVICTAATPDDVKAASKVDTSYSTNQMYIMECSWDKDGAKISLAVQKLEQPLEKKFPLDSLEVSDRLILAKLNDAVVGFTLLEFQDWNSRAVIQHLYVEPSFRRLGIGKQLVDALLTRAKLGRNGHSYRCLWLEAQNTNINAISFYLCQGFQLCGFDHKLYDPRDASVLPGEFALFFALDL